MIQIHNDLGLLRYAAKDLQEQKEYENMIDPHDEGNYQNYLSAISYFLNIKMMLKNSQ